MSGVRTPLGPPKRKEYECNMKDYKQRVIDEKAELDAKISRLDEFIIRSPLFRDLSEDAKADLRHQLSTMRPYSKSLGVRISKF